MTGPELAALAVNHPNRALARMRRSPVPPGLSDAFFREVLRLFAVDHAALQPLAAVARTIAERGDQPALGHRAHAIVLRARGEWRASAEAFLRAGDAATTPADRLAFATGAIDALARAGDPEGAITLGRRLHRGLRRLGQEGLAARVALNLAYACMQQDRYAEALRWVRGLATTLHDQGFEVEAASAFLAESTCHLFGGTVQASRTAALNGIARAERLELDQLADMARLNLAYTDLLRGDGDLALNALLDLRDRQADVPLEHTRCLEYLGDTYVAMNLWTEAADVYGEALDSGARLQPLHRAHLQLGRGRALVSSGSEAAGRQELTRARRLYGQLHNRAWQAAAEIELAETPAAALRNSARATTAQSPRFALAAKVRAAELGAPDRVLDEAAREQKRWAVAALGWRIEAERARRSHGAARLRHYRRMFDAILADQARTSSFASRGAILRDKAPAMAAYLAELLANPTLAHVREALDVVRRSRSIALLDELLQAQRSEVDAEALLQLRAELNSEAGGGTTGARRSGGGRNLDRLQRQWTEVSHQWITHVETQIPTGDPDTAVVIQLADRFEVLRAGRAQTVEITPKQLDARLRWLHYDLLAPMVERDTPAEPALRGLERLGRELQPYFSSASGVSPDGVMWRIPWGAWTGTEGAPWLPEIRLHPSLRGGTPFAEGPVLLWVAEHEDLPGAHQEGMEFLARFPHARVCRTADEARRSLREEAPGLLHVISHAHHRRRNPMLSSINFPDGAIVAAEIARTRLAANLVTLSGCDTGRVSDTNRMEPDGLVRAFLAAGSGNVIGSAWPLDDEAAVRLYREFFDRWTAGNDLGLALRHAQAAVRQWREHPYFWASPLLYGGYRA